MKNYISKGLSFFFITISLFAFMFPSAVSAQSGHGGSTEVIARIEPESTAPTRETQPCPVQPEPPDTQPIQTGEAVAWLAFIILLASGTVLTVLYLTGNKKQK